MTGIAPVRIRLLAVGGICLALGGCAAAPHPLDLSQLNPRTIFVVSYSNPNFRTEPEDRGQACSKDYPAVLRRAAAKDAAALGRLFQISATSRWDAAGAEFHFSHMRRMLLLWGDQDFAQVLIRQPKNIRQRVLHSLNAPDPALPHLFPRTYAAATAG